MAAMLLTATACDGGDGEPGDGGGSGTSAAPAGLPDVADGRLVRLLGDGTPDPLDGTEPAAQSGVAGPILVTPGGDGELVGLQTTYPSLFTIGQDGTATAVEGQQVFGEIPAAGVVTGDALFLVAGSGTEALVGTLSLADAAFTEAARLTGADTSVPTAAVLDLPDATWLFWAGTWWTLDGTLTEPAGAQPAEPPVEGAVAAARTESGVAVLTDSELVLLDESLRETGRSAWTPPADAEGQTVTAATGDGADGLIVTTAGLEQRRDSGSVLHVTPDGVTMLATGSKPGGGTPSTNCDDADVAADAAHLSRPVSVTLWQNRVVVADQACHSLLQLPIPAAG